MGLISPFNKALITVTLKPPRMWKLSNFTDTGFAPSC
jgi:hypothetical protein